MTDRNGILQNSPLAYVLASVRFAPWQLMAKKIDEIHDDLRDIVPLLNPIQMQMFSPNGFFLQNTRDIPATAWMLMPNDRAYGINLLPDQLLILHKKYVCYKEFENIIDQVLEVLIKHMRFIDVISTGVRYVDHIKVSEGKTLCDYVHQRLLPAELDDMDSIGGISNSMYANKSSESEVRVQVISLSTAPEIPEDIIGTLAMMQEPTTPFDIKPIGDGAMLLDIDSVKNNTQSKRMKKQEILEQLDSLHNQANLIFRNKSIYTDFAFDKWKERS